MQLRRIEQEKVVAVIEDEFGEKRVIHRDSRGRLSYKRNRSTVAMTMSRIIGEITGRKIRSARQKRNMSLRQLCLVAGIVAAPGREKFRMREIEVGGRTGVRLGTLYAIAAALEVAPADLLPTLSEAMTASNVSFQRSNDIKLTVGENGNQHL
jgi:transcriptional regulator with XRE-family HTH domain